MQLYGEHRTRREIEARVGRLGQIGGIRRMKLTEGKQAGMELVEVRTGAGLSFEVSLSKGMDISLAQLWGVPLSWQSPNGDVHPMYYESCGTDWLRSASGGLLMTCGLSHVGSPSVDETGSHGLHGRVHHTPATQISIRQEWEGDELNWSVSGVVEETAIFGSKLRLRRHLSGRMGENSIVIHDQVENFGFQPAVHMMLYHFNFGFPLMGEHTRILLPEAEKRETRGSASFDLEQATKWAAPHAAVQESVYYHHLSPGTEASQQMAKAGIYNPFFPSGERLGLLNVTLQWSQDTLPMLVQWKMPGAGDHVLGLEPANCRVEGRQVQHSREGLPMIQPGETICYRLELNLSSGTSIIEA